MYLDKAVEEIFRASLVSLDFYTLDFYTEKPIERVRALWLGGRFSIRGRPWSEEFDRPTGDAVEIGPYEDMHIHRAGKNGDTLRIYQRPKKGSQLGWPEAVWGELTISDDGFARLNESLTAPVTIDQSIKADPLEAYKQRVAEFKERGETPPLETTKGGTLGDREWAIKKDVSRTKVEAWRKAFVSERKLGRRSNSARNSAKE